MPSAPIKWLAKVGGAILKTGHDNLSDAVNKVFDDVNTLKEECEAGEYGKPVVNTNVVTQAGVASLDAIQANPNVQGTLANKVHSAESNISSIGSDLTAQNDKKFRFAYNASTNEYGYLIAGSGGTDTFHPFSNAAELYKALRYSGLVEPDDTFAEMCDALEGYFKDTTYDTTSTWTTNHIENAVTRSGKDVLLQCTGWNGDNRTFTASNIPIGNYNMMRIKGTFVCEGSATGTKPTLTITVGVNKEYEKTFDLPADEDFEIDVEAHETVVVRMDSYYSTPYATLSIQLYNGTISDGNIVDAVLTTKEITAKGTYKASDDNADGYSSVTVNVSDNYDAFWDAIQHNGKRTSYSKAFKFFTDELFKPKYKIIPTGDNTEMFSDSTIQASDVLAEYVDFSKCEIGDRMFVESGFKTLPELDFTSAVSLNDLFSGSVLLERVEKLILGSDLKHFNNPFFYLPKLSHIIIDGQIPNSISLTESPLLDAESVQSIIDALADVTDREITQIHDATMFSIDTNFDEYAVGTDFENISTKYYDTVKGNNNTNSTISPKYVVDASAEHTDNMLAFTYVPHYDKSYRFKLKDEYTHLLGDLADDKDLVVEFDFVIRGSSHKPSGYCFSIDEPSKAGTSSTVRFVITSSTFIQYISSKISTSMNIDGQAMNHLKVIIHKRDRRYGYYLNGVKIADSIKLVHDSVDAIQVLRFRAIKEDDEAVTDSKLFVDNLKMYVQDPAIEKAGKPKVTFHDDIVLSSEQKAQIEAKGWIV